ncbi:MAG TPA: hypothetical protein DCY13_03785 [Verrucomicrobiales bacterium]|nr:hypothetical protein [Verrucomicrobiales bacterium]
MNALPTHCQLCGHDVPQEHVRQHRATETDEIVRYTINMIKARHPEWTENDPACQKCWDFYRQL